MDSKDSPQWTQSMQQEDAPQRKESRGLRRLVEKWRLRKSRSGSQVDSSVASTELSARTTNGNDTKVTKDVGGTKAEEAPMETPETSEFYSGDSNAGEAPMEQSPLEARKDLMVEMEVTASDAREVPASGFTEMGKLYYLQMQDGIVQIVGNIGDKVVLIKAKTCEVASGCIEQAQITLIAKAVWIQDGCLYITAKVDGQVIHIKSKAYAIFDLTEAKATQILDQVGEYAAPVTSRAGAFKGSVTSRVVALKESVSSRSAALYNSSRERCVGTVQPFKPYYAKVHNGVVHIVATVGNKVVCIQAKISDGCTSIQVRILASATAAQAMAERFASPFVSKAVSLRNATVSRIDCFTVRIKSGIVCVRGAVNERTIRVQARISEITGAVCATASKGINATKGALSELTAKLVGMLSSTYGQVHNTVKILCMNTRDGILQIFCQVNDKIVVLRIKVAEAVEHLRSMPVHLYTTGRTAIVDGCSLAKVKMLNAVDFTKTKSLEVGANFRSVAGDRRTQVTAASAATGALALGAGGAATGLVAGGGLGAGCGVALAPFTFGLSIPVGATLGAGAGLVLGSAAGGTAGLAAGGAAGYGAHRHKDDISKGVDGAVSKAKAYRALAAASTNKLCQQVMGSTGGTCPASH